MSAVPQQGAAITQDAATVQQGGAPAPGTVTSITTTTNAAMRTTAATAAASSDTISINVGGPAEQWYVADQDAAGGVDSVTSATIANAIPNAAPEAVYQSQRYGPMTYTVHGFSAGAAYTVRLHFAEIYFGAPGRAGGVGSRQFNVAINGTTVLTNLDVYSRAGGAEKAYNIEEPATADSSGTITVALTTGAANLPMLSGLQIYRSSGGAVSDVGSEQPHMADAFVDTIGVNTHLSNFQTLYGENFGLVKSLIERAGIRYVRDGLPSSNASLCASEASFSSVGIGMDILANGNASDLASSVSCLGRAVSTIEGVNEADLNNGPDWVSFLLANTRAIAATYPQFALIAPSVTTVQAENALGSMESIVDYGNVHAYFAGRNPGTPGWGGRFPYGVYGSMQFELGLAAVISGSKPPQITETGYSEAADTYAVPPVTKARYTLRTLLEAYNHGVARTYLYELIDESGPPFSHYGLLDSSGNAKPVYTALSNFIHQLSDPGASFATTPLAYSLQASANVHHTLLQRRDGSYSLILWNEIPEWDPNANQPIAVTPETVNVTFAKAPSSIATTTFADSGESTTTKVASGANLSFKASAWPTIVQINP